MTGNRTVEVLMAIGPWLAAAAAQHVPVVGQVLDGLGAPVAGARVHISLRASPDEAVPPTRQVASTDATGRFAARVQPGCSHSIFAVHADGTRCSPLVEGVVIGRPLELRLTLATPTEPAVLDPLAVWAACGPFRLEATPAAANPFWSPVRKNEPLRLPGPIWLQVVDGNNQVLHRAAWTPGQALRVPPPVVFTAVVQDTNGNTIAGATIAHQVPTLVAPGTAFDQPEISSWRIAGTTDANGRVQIALPDPTGQAPRPVTMLQVTAPGRLPTLLWSDGKSLQPRTRQLNPDDPTPVVLVPAAQLRVLRRGAAVPGAHVHLLANGFSGNHITEGLMATTDADGLLPLALPAAPIETMLRIEANGEPPAFLRIPPWKAGETSVVDLAGTRPAAWQLVDENGQPLGGVPGTLVACGSHLAPDVPALFQTDPLGQFRCSLGVDAWLLVFRDGERAVAVDIGDGGKQPRITSGTLVAAPLPHARVRVAGLPLPATAFQLTPAPPFGLPAQRLEPHTLRREITMRSDRRYLKQHPVSTDGDGLATLPLLSVPPDGLSVYLLRGATPIGPWLLERNRECTIELGR